MIYPVGSVPHLEGPSTSGFGCVDIFGGGQLGVASVYSRNVANGFALLQKAPQKGEASMIENRVFGTSTLYCRKLMGCGTKVHFKVLQGRISVVQTKNIICRMKESSHSQKYYGF